MATLAPEVARLGGDEFTVIMPGLHDPQDAAKLARRLISSFAHPIRVGTHEIFINASIGIAIYPYDGEDLDTLLMHADTAMYKAKEQGGNSYQTYSKSMTTTALQRLTLENDLRRALERNEFEVHYQPILDVVADRVVAAEALLRWRDPDRGLVLPSTFLPLAEDTGLIVPIGEQVLRTACEAFVRWREQGAAPDLRMCVNLSAVQLREHTFERRVAAILAETGCPASALTLELTENSTMIDGEMAIETLRALKLLDHVKHKVVILQKSIRHTPFQKMTDALIANLAGTHGLAEINTKPRGASRRATSRPMPLLAPVTRATLTVNSSITNSVLHLVQFSRTLRKVTE
jgi:predicted signal transduction protein with EAL and GGDEF domain